MNANIIILGATLIFGFALVVDGTDHHVSKKHGHGHGHESRSHPAMHQRAHQSQHRHHLMRHEDESASEPEIPVCPPCNCYDVWEIAEEVVSENGDSGAGSTIPSPPPPSPNIPEPTTSSPSATSPPAAQKRGRVNKKHHGHSARGHHH